MNNKNYVYNNRIYGIPDRDYFFDSWPVIIIALIFFPLIGLILLLRKRALHRRNLFKAGNISIGVGIFFIAIGMLYISVLSDLEVTIDVFDFLIKFITLHFIVGTVVLILGLLTKVTASKYRKYIKLVVNRGTEDINVICQEMKLSRKKVIKDLDNLISKRYLERYVINEQDNKIYLPEVLLARQKQEESMKIREELLKARKEKLKRIVTCKNCGANNLVEERIGKCQYCNSYIE